MPSAPHQVGDGGKQSVCIITHGKERLSVNKSDAIFYFSEVEVEPTVGVSRPGLYFRKSGGQWQMCVLFPSGVAQILSTEP